MGSLGRRFGLRDLEFFRLLNEQADAVHSGAGALHHLLTHFGQGDAQHLADNVLAVRQFEHRGDDLEQAVVKRLKQAIRVPLSRADIHNVATKLEYILDILEGVADRIELYAIDTFTPEVLALSGALVEETAALAQVVQALGSLNAQRVLDASQQLKRIEADSDRHYREGVARLFKSTDYDPLEVLKLKEVLEHMEQAADECEDLADLIEGIVIKHT